MRAATDRAARRVLMIGALVLAASVPAFGRAHRDGGIGGGAFFGEPRTLHALDLTAEQRRTIQVVVRAHQAALRRLVTIDKAARHAVDDALLGTGALAPEDLDREVQKELETHDALVRERVATALAVRDVLTPEQIGQVAALRAAVEQVHGRVHELVPHPIGPQ